MTSQTVQGVVPNRQASPRSSGARQAMSDGPPPSTPKPKLPDQVRQAIRARHYSRRTEDVYVMWIKRFIFFHHIRHPAEMGEPEMQPIFHFPSAICHLSSKLTCPLIRDENRKWKMENGRWKMENRVIYTHVLKRGGKGVRSPADTL